MRIHIENNIYISADRRNYSVDEKVIIKRVGVEKEEYKTIGGNYTSLAGAINGVLKLKISDSKAETLDQLATEIKAWREELTALVTI